jgi:hypothetical protein
MYQKLYEKWSKKYHILALVGPGGWNTLWPAVRSNYISLFL